MNEEGRMCLQRVKRESLPWFLFPHQHVELWVKKMQVMLYKQVCLEIVKASHFQTAVLSGPWRSCSKAATSFSTLSFSCFPFLSLVFSFLYPCHFSSHPFPQHFFPVSLSLPTSTVTEQTMPLPAYTCWQFGVCVRVWYYRVVADSHFLHLLDAFHFRARPNKAGGHR